MMAMKTKQMKDFITYDINSKLGEEEIFDLVTKILPNFKWRRGDSDAIGPYVSGRNNGGVRIELVLGENPIEMSVSFRSVPPGISEQENHKLQLVQLIQTTLLPSLGIVVKKNS